MRMPLARYVRTGWVRKTERSGGGECRLGHRVADQRAVAFERKAAGFFEGARPEANVGQGVALLQA